MSKAGAILSGGRSRRMGRDKALLMIDGEMVLARIARQLSAYLDRVAVVAGRQQVLPPLPPTIAIIRDEVDYAGPLHGLRAALRNMPPEFNVLFVTACDAPFPQPQLILHLFERAAEADVVLPQVAGKMQPLFAVYRREISAKIDAVIAGGRSSLRDLLENCRCDFVGEAELRRFDPELRSFENLNTPGDYERVLELERASNNDR